MPSPYQPPIEITPGLLSLVAEIGEQMGRLAVFDERAASPQLRRENRLKTIQASLEIENNTLTLEQVTAVLEGKRVLGPPREIQEVKNAFEAYEHLHRWVPAREEDLLEAHGILMKALTDDAGRFRSGQVGVYHGEKLVHIAPPADRAVFLVRDLLTWLGQTDHHPLIASAVVHYELEFIHPFTDGNGRMGRLWQTLILSQWKPQLAYLPVETVVRDRQADYYAALGQADREGSITPFAHFILSAILRALQEVGSTEQVVEQVTEQVEALVRALYETDSPLSTKELLQALKLKHRPTFLANYLEPALALGLVGRTDPDSPRSPRQAYRLTAAGERLAKPHFKQR